jgi:hypothetical protein
MDPDPERVYFENALARIGFGLTERNAFIQASSCLNAAMMGLLSSEQISRICKRLATRAVDPIPLLAIQEQLLLALHFWVAKQQRLQQIIAIDNFTVALALNQAQEIRQILEDEAQDHEQTAKLPDKFKVASQWKIFAEALDTYLGQLCGSDRVPLNNIIGHTAVALPEEAYETEQARLVALAPLNGPPYHCVWNYQTAGFRGTWKDIYISF